MSLALTLLFYDPTMGVDQHNFTTKVLLPTAIDVPFNAGIIEEQLRQAAYAFDYENWGGVMVYKDDGLQTVTTDAYGKKLLFIKADALADVLSTVTPEHLKYVSIGWHQRSATEIDRWARAIHAFVSRLHPETPVTLYWH